MSRCPVHSGTDDLYLDSWSCPDSCEHFAAEIQRRIADVTVDGNFWRTWKGDDGVRYKQQYRNHQPVGHPTPWMRSSHES